jgi:hypothetical protein
MAADDQTILKVNLLPDNQDASVELTSSSPDLDAFVEKIVAYKDKIKVETITVMCDDEQFDTESFKEIVTTSIKDFLTAIALEQTKFDEVIEGLKDEQDGEEQDKEGQADA